MGNLTIQDVAVILDQMAPVAYAEDFDNVGLLVGNAGNPLTGILVCHDALPEVVAEAAAKNCNLVVCFHPIVFSGLKKITGKTYVERAVMLALRHDIAIYAVHTSLDNHIHGVNRIFCDALGLQNPKILIPKKQFIRKLVTYTVPENADHVRDALFRNGAGNIGNYDHCSFNSEGTGTYRGNECSDPVVGQKGELTRTHEARIEVTFEKHHQARILQALFDAHLYEEVAYEVYELENEHQHIGLGMIAELDAPMDEPDFLKMVRDKMRCGGIRHSAFTGKPVRKVAVLGGSGASAIGNAIRAGADAFLTSDLKYHNYFEAEGKLLLADIGHYESERYTKNYIVEFLREKIANFAIVLSETNTNPVNYL